MPEQQRALLTEVWVVGRRRQRQQDRELNRQRNKVILPRDLDEGSRLMLARTQVAIDSVLTAEVRAAGLLEADEPALRRHEWEIACALRNLSEMRNLAPPDASVGAMTAAVADSQQRALALAEEALAGRIAALERYADEVASADEARQDWQAALRLSGLNDRYLDLLARTAADDLAVAELGALTDRAAVTVQVLRDSLRDASLAAEVLALPPPQAS